MEKLLIFIPTYNESENVRPLYERLKRLPLEADILFIDDNSPDGTGKIIDGIASTNGSVSALHRKGKEGIGSAHQAGVDYAYDNGYDTLVTMDCDFTHDPDDIPRFISGSEDSDIVVGSRYMRKDSLTGWKFHRKVLTNLGHFLTRHLLGMPFDATGAFRLYRLDRINREIFRRVKSKGYSFFFESLFALMANGLRIKEIPITLPPRTYGHSKMSFGDIRQSVVRLFELYFDFTVNKQLYVVKSGGESIDTWDKYWEGKTTRSSAIYDRVASFYRDYIIKGTLNRYIGRHFPPGSVLLHAGAGSGQVDADIARRFRIIPLDLSVSALKLYRENIGPEAPLIRGDIFRLPIADASLDGLYNLGVMEHFTEDEIDGILIEFKRVVREGGKIVLFWPPEFGLSVMFLKGVHFVLNKVLRMGVKLHPDEITRIRSRRHIMDVLKRAGLEAVELGFGIRDLFTYYIVVAKKPGSSDASSGEGFDARRFLACPSCGASPLEGEGALRCPSCKRGFKETDGIYYLTPGD